MKNLLFSFILLFVASEVFTQSFTVTFQPKVAGVKIDSIRVINLTKNESSIVGESEALTLGTTTGFANLNFFQEGGTVYPNPCEGNTGLYFYTQSDQDAGIMICNISGQILASRNERLIAGNHRFNLSIPAAGLYHVVVRASGRSFTFKLLSTGFTPQDSRIFYQGVVPGFYIKSLVISGKSLKYSPGDVLHCNAFSGKNCTVIADSPTATKIYQVEFFGCSDADNQDYPIVKINTQWWMAKNLQTSKYNDGTSISNVTDNAAWSVLTTGACCWYKNDITNKANYGTLYNWFAVNTGKLCPAGWHVPSDAEWTVLENYLINNGYNYDGTQTGNKIAKSMAATTVWTSNSTVGTVGNSDYPAYRNKSGFSGLPGGYRDYTGAFGGATNECYWWSSTENSATNALFRYLYANFSKFDLYNYGKLHGFSIRCVRN